MTLLVAYHAKDKEVPGRKAGIASRRWSPVAELARVEGGASVGSDVARVVGRVIEGVRGRDSPPSDAKDTAPPVCWRWRWLRRSVSNLAKEKKRVAGHAIQGF